MDHPPELRRNPGVVYIHTKAGELTVADDCNVKYGTNADYQSVILNLDLDHRSEDITALSRLRLSPDQARDLGHQLLNVADHWEEGYFDSG